MADPSVMCEIAFESNAFAGTPTWDDVSSDLLEYSFTRGRQSELDQMQAGQCTVLLNNSHYNYYSGNTSSPYYDNVRPVKRLRLRMVYNGGTYSRFDGYIEKWTPEWRGNAGKAPIMRVDVSDGLRNVGYCLLNDNTGYSAEQSGTRIGNVLDDVGWAADDRDIATGQENIIASGTISNVNALDHLLKVQETELGILFVSDDGKMTFHDRHTRATGSFGTSQATFGDDDGEMKYADVKLVYDEYLFYNQIRATRQGGVEQVVNGTINPSTNYGIRVLNRTGLLMAYDVQTQTYAADLASRYGALLPRAESLTILPQRDPANLFPKTFGYDISTRITLRLNQANLDKDYFIEGISESAEGKDRVYSTEWKLGDATRYLYTPHSVDLVLRPMGTGAVTTIPHVTPSGTAHWIAVKDVTADDDTSYVMEDDVPGDGPVYDVYATEDSAYTGGTVNSITVCARCRQVRTTGANGEASLRLRANGTTYAGGTTNFGTSQLYQNIAHTWASHPNGSGWTWTDINTIQIGVSVYPPLIAGLPGGETRCTQVWGTVNYTPAW